LKKRMRSIESWEVLTNFGGWKPFF
jgi:hypothetical protein